LTIGALMLVRAHGIALLVALMLVFVARRRWYHAVVAGATVMFVQLPWLVWAWRATPRVPAPLEGAYGSYLGWLGAGVREGGVLFVFKIVRVNFVECWLLLQDRL